MFIFQYWVTRASPKEDEDGNNNNNNISNNKGKRKRSDKREEKEERRLERRRESQLEERCGANGIDIGLQVRPSWALYINVTIQVSELFREAKVANQPFYKRSPT